jgi:hypothetical protein
VSYAIRRPILNSLAWLFAAALVALLLWRTAIPAMSARTYAFSAYYTSARLTLEGQAGVRFCEPWFFAQQHALGFGDRADFFCPNPPTTALLMLPVAWLPAETARAAWVALDILMALGIVAIGRRVIRQLLSRQQDTNAPSSYGVVPWRLSGAETSAALHGKRLSEKPARGGAWTLASLRPAGWVEKLPFVALAAIVLALFRPLHADWRTNQVYTLIALLYALWLYGYVARKDWLCGAALAGLALAKLSGWPLWLLMLAARRWRALAWAVGLGCAGLLLSLPLLGLGFWRLYLFDQLRLIPAEPSSAVPANQTLSSLLRQCFAYDQRWSPRPLLDAPWLAGALWWLLALALLAPTLILAIRRTPAASALAMMCLVVPLQPAGEEYHYTLLLVVLIVVLASWRGSAAGAFALIAALLLFALPPYFLDTAAFGGWPQALLAYPRMYGSLVLWGVLLAQGIDINDPAIV